MADLVHSITIESKPKDVYAAVATRKGMRGRWTADPATRPTLWLQPALMPLRTSVST